MSLDDLRVHTAVVDVPYLPRPTKEREVCEHLRARRPVLIVGPSMVGKTRLAAVAVRQVLPDTPLLLPDSPTALGDLDKADITPDQHVIWLDDLDRFLINGGLTAGLIQRLQTSNWIVATLRGHEWDRLQPTDQLRSPEWDVLRLFQLVLLDRDRDRPTDEDLRCAVPDEDIRARIARTGIGEYVGAAQHVRDQLTVAESANPLGYALVAGVADWSRMGLTRAVPAELLPRLAKARLTGRRRDELDNDEKYRAALDWAAREINPTVSLLEPADGTYRVYDLVLDHLATATDRTVPATTWQLAIDEAAADELTAVGYQAAMIHELPDIAGAAWQKAADAGNLDAMSNLGVLLKEWGDTVEAERWWRQAANAGHLLAMSNLGALLQERGDIAEAEHWYRQAANAGHLFAMHNLGVLLQERGDIAEAEHWYRQAANAGHLFAMHNLGVLLQERGDIAEAEHWCHQAANAGHRDAMFNLGVLLQERGATVEAEHWWRQAANAGQPEAMHNLGVLLHERGDTAEAEHWWYQAANVS
ncbi:sel1 repeat family protein [Amycolatopsis acidiphila]|uniref:Sel1 repeat family protein n=1 Tax=Amycolatopsis acidiphila TaxID=715473 RepID=A0A558A6X7_9PSEU|nr:tetratricopeptide repeat protein [Amycolatopsis acidiphila]TVT20002.1 sel1 repeat family protein [Amycolatopsis acidiphila]UIJ63465.1 sel1 repeat family protein [Amycolatopsis acidiphila]GHG68773.1 hypothetical protein GCM10017788_28820 [Amycolatopsis acidiphila]